MCACHYDSLIDKYYIKCLKKNPKLYKKYKALKRADKMMTRKCRMDKELKREFQVVTPLKPNEDYYG